MYQQIVFLPGDWNGLAVSWTIAFYVPLALFVFAAVDTQRLRIAAKSQGGDSPGDAEPDRPGSGFRTLPYAATLALLALLAVPAVFPWPTYDRRTLKEIRAESRILMRTYPVTGSTEVPRSRWPRAIASLEPEDVRVRPDGVHIWAVPFFDGGWGYLVARDERKPPEWEERYIALGEGVYWWRPL